MRYMLDQDLAQEILAQILVAIERIERRFTTINSSDDFIKNEEGIDRLDAICMMLIATGESLKNLDKVTHGKLLASHPEVDWKGAKGMRDIISHHYFDLNAEAVFIVCSEKISGLKAAIIIMQKELENLA